MSTGIFLKLVREPLPDLTFGKLYLNDVYFCETLEDVDRKLEAGGVKIPGDTAIPRGKYRVTIDHSQRFGRDMMHVLDVPGFTGIRIHSGNTIADTEGCILLGMARGKNFLLSSRYAVNYVFIQVLNAVKAGRPVILEVE